jgi:hypothetical protein
MAVGCLKIDSERARDFLEGSAAAGVLSMLMVKNHAGIASSHERGRLWRALRPGDAFFAHKEVVQSENLQLSW